MNLRTLLLLNGIFFFTLSMGLALGAKLNLAALTVFSLFTIGVLLLFAAAALWKRDFQVGKAYYKRLLQVKNRPVGLDDAFRAFRAYGRQPPLVQDQKVESHAFSTDARVKFELPYRIARVFVEHWQGPEALVRENSRSFLLEERQIVSFVVDHGEVEIEPRAAREGQRIDGVLHFISLEGSVQ